MNISELSRDYFSKTKVEQHLIYTNVFVEVLDYVLKNELGFEEVCNEVSRLISLAESKEDYEVAQVLNKLNKELQDIWAVRAKAEKRNQ